MNEPIYRWECTVCGASGESESSGMARRALNAHLALVHAGADTAQRSGTDPGSTRSS